MTRSQAGRRLFLASALLLTSAAVLAQDAREPVRPGLSAQCREATNGCEVCRIDDTGAARCSLPGIACQPAAWRCIKAATGPVDSLPAPRPDAR